MLLFVNVDREMRRKSIIYKKYEESGVRREGERETERRRPLYDATVCCCCCTPYAAAAVCFAGNLQIPMGLLESPSWSHAMPISAPAGGPAATVVAEDDADEAEAPVLAALAAAVAAVAPVASLASW